MKPLQIEGSPDEEDLVRTVNMLVKLGIRPERIIRNGFLEWNADLSKARWTASWDEPAHAGESGWVLQHPDIMILDPQDLAKVKAIVEIDGSAHDTRPGRKRTYKRNLVYEEMEIPWVIHVERKPKDDTWYDSIEETFTDVIGKDTTF